MGFNLSNHKNETFYIYNINSMVSFNSFFFLNNPNRYSGFQKVWPIFSKFLALKSKYFVRWIERITVAVLFIIRKIEIEYYFYMILLKYIRAYPTLSNVQRLFKIDHFLIAFMVEFWIGSWQMIFVWIHFTGIKGCLLTFERMGRGREAR